MLAIKLLFFLIILTSYLSKNWYDLVSTAINVPVGFSVFDAIESAKQY